VNIGVVLSRANYRLINTRKAVAKLPTTESFRLNYRNQDPHSQHSPRRPQRRRPRQRWMSVRSQSIRHPQAQYTGAQMQDQSSRRQSRTVEYYTHPAESHPTSQSLAEYRDIVTTTSHSSSMSSFDLVPSRQAPPPPPASSGAPPAALRSNSKSNSNTNGGESPTSSSPARVRNSLHKAPPPRKMTPKSPNPYGSVNGNPPPSSGGAAAALPQSPPPPRPSRANTANLNDMFKAGGAASSPAPITPALSSHSISRRASLPSIGGATFVSEPSELPQQSAEFHASPSAGTRSRSGTAQGKNKKGGMLSFMSGN
jgi:p21-activated kinase 1